LQACRSGSRGGRSNDGFPVDAKIGLIVAIIALFAAMAGWVSDTEAASSRKPKSNSQMRYYGGPKSPMWRGQ